VVGEKSNALSRRSLRLFLRSTTVPNITTTTRAKTPAEAKTAIIAGLSWKKATPSVEVWDEDWDSDGVRAWEGSALVIVATVVLGAAGSLGAEVGGGVSEGFENTKGIKEEEVTEEELATGESVEESVGPGSVVVLTLLKTLCWAKCIRRRVRTHGVLDEAADGEDCEDCEDEDEDAPELVEVWAFWAFDEGRTTTGSRVDILTTELPAASELARDMI
jgi:hypothetical protein